jgi:uncharacterized protein YndB with AHSA1/START domain
MTGEKLLGTLHRTGERMELQFTRSLAHPPDKVWRSITEAEHLAAWFPDRMEGDRAVGATLHFVPEGHEDSAFDGKVLVFDPPRVFEFLWGDDTLRFELASSGAGTVLTLTDTFDELGKAARDAAGWHECLDYLEVELAGKHAPWKPGELWQQVHPQYVERFGPEASTIGPPEGWND